MTSELPAVDLIERPVAGRVFTNRARVRLGDVDHRGELRLDATARLLQDVATDDASDAQLDRRFGWLVRRTLIDTGAPARLGEPLVVSTWCTAIGRAWAERRSQVVGERGALIDAVSLWVQIDIESGHPVRVADDFTSVYGPTSAGRSVSARLSVPAPDDRASSVGSWSVRRTDIDPYRHVNNAATWAFVEQHLVENSRVGRAELEYLDAIELDDHIEVHRSDAGPIRSGWLIRSGKVCAAARWTSTSS